MYKRQTKHLESFVNETTHSPKVSQTQDQLSLHFFSTAFSIFFWLVKMAHIPLVSCSSHAAVCYSMEQAKSMVMNDQSPDSYSGSVCDFLCWLYCEWLGNKLCRKAKHVHSINSMASKSNLNFKINQPIVCSIQLFLNWGIDGWVRMSGWEDTAV